jgi:hypothetical protein
MAGNPPGHIENRDPGALATLQSLPPGVSTGALVLVRGRQWRVRVRVDHQDCLELHLHSADGESRVLLWPFDRPSPVDDRRAPRLLRLPRWAASAGAALADALDARAPRAVFRGEVLPYQLAPAIAVASGVTRVVLADEVGLGKTVQAGWIAADLLSREPDARVLLAVPAGLREQWAAELRRFFQIECMRVDAGWLRGAVADRPPDVSPWAAPGLYLGSIDFLKRADVARSLTDVIWDLLIVDEAHTAMAPTDRHAAMARVAAGCRRVVVVTATPYSGDAAGFASMIALGARPGDEEPIMFRRSRDEVGDARRRRHRFTTLRIGRAEFRLQRLLERYSRAVWHDAPGDADNARLAMTVLRKRALSSPAATLRSLVRRHELLGDTAAAPRQLALFDDDDDDALPDAALATPGLADRGLEERWLQTLIDAAIAATDEDAKARWLARLLRRIGDEPVIVFTEYRDTLTRLAESWPAALQLHGGLTSGERAAVQRTFNTRGGILLATDAAADGLNLQQRCRLLINYELPWNPARLEQRIGRVDRIGQRRTVHAISLVARDTAEDLVVAALARRLTRVATTLGERDRLASFLSDARTARCVIAGATTDPPDEMAPAAPVARPAPDEYPAERVAAAQRSRRIPARDVRGTPVACIRSRGALAPGCAVLLRVAAVAGAGTIAERPLVIHVPQPDPRRPATRAEARARAASAMAIAERAAPELDDVRGWFEAVLAVHRASVHKRTVREEWLRRAADPPPEVQPGLFDRRATLDLERRLDTTGRRACEHQRRLLALQDASRARLECTAAAVLVAWR